MKKLHLTVQDVLQRQSFSHAELVAGEQGLNRQVKWSHILEAQDFNSLINGGELILTTGVGLTSDIELQKKYLKQLIDGGVSALCIELGPNYKTVPNDVIALANKHEFPIIVFLKVVKFVDITQDLHTHIINQHHEKLYLLDTMSRSFLSLSLKHNGILKILQAIAEYYNSHVFFITATDRSYYYPTYCKEESDILAQHFSTTIVRNNDQLVAIEENVYAFLPIRGLGQTWGHLVLQTDEHLADEFLYLLLDRAALAIAQISLRNRTIEERKQNLESEFVWNALTGRDFNKGDVQSFFPQSSNDFIFRVFIIRLSPDEDYLSEDYLEEAKLQRSMLVRSIFKQHITFPAVAIKQHEVAIIASFLPQDSEHKEKEKFTDIITSLKNMKKEYFQHEHILHFGISSVFHHIDQAHTAYKEATTAMSLIKKDISTTYFYEELGIYRLLTTLPTEQLENYVTDYLQPLIDYDNNHNSFLVGTLQMYFTCNTSKKDTAEQLFIVRQTLYHRLERIEQLLGSDFTDPHTRLSIEVALKAHTLIENLKS